MQNIIMEISITEEDVKTAINRQVRVALAQLFQSGEINELVKKSIREYVPSIIETSIKEVSQDEIKQAFLEKLQEGIVSKVKTRLRGL